MFLIGVIISSIFFMSFVWEMKQEKKQKTEENKQLKKEERFAATLVRRELRKAETKKRNQEKKEKLQNRDPDVDLDELLDKYKQIDAEMI